MCESIQIVSSYLTKYVSYSEDFTWEPAAKNIPGYNSFALAVRYSNKSDKTHFSVFLFFSGLFGS